MEGVTGSSPVSPTTRRRYHFSPTFLPRSGTCPSLWPAPCVVSATTPELSPAALGMRKLASTVLPSVGARPRMSSALTMNLCKGVAGTGDPHGAADVGPGARARPVSRQGGLDMHVVTHPGFVAAHDDEIAGANEWRPSSRLVRKKLYRFPASDLDNGHFARACPYQALARASKWNASLLVLRLTTLCPCRVSRVA